MVSIKEKSRIIERFNFEYEPVCVGFLLKPPEGLKRLGKKLTFCEMVKEAQKGFPFWADLENHRCEAGAYVLGWKDLPLPYLSGAYGVAHGHFKEPRAMRRIYKIIPKLEKNVISITAFSPLSKLSFEPDLMIFTTDFKRTKILLRASTYTLGRPYKSIFTSVLGCAWLFIHPYLTGELNCLPSNFSAGMEFLKVFPEDCLITSVPYEILPILLENLEEMPWVLPLIEKGEEFRLKIRKELGID